MAIDAARVDEDDYEMLDIGHWPFARVAVASALWVVLNIALAIGFLYLQFRRLHAQSSGSGGIGAVSAGIGELAFIILYLFGPPIVLTLVWYFVRRSSRRSRAV